MKSINILFLLQIVTLICLGCVICDHCGDIDTTDIVSAADNADVILKGSIIEQSSCDQNGEYSEVYILQQCIYGTDRSFMFASTTPGVTPKHLVRGLKVCEQEKDTPYVFFLNLEPSSLFAEALQCAPQTIDNGMILYANDTSLIIPMKQETEDVIEEGILQVANTKSCASVRSSTQPEEPPFQDFCKCTAQDNIEEEEVSEVVVVNVQSSTSSPPPPSSSTQQSVVIDRVTDIVTEQALVIDQDRQVSFDDGVDENGVLASSVGVFASAVVATFAFLAFIY